MIALLNLSVLGFLLVVFHDKAKRTQQGNLLPPASTVEENKKNIQRNGGGLLLFGLANGSVFMIMSPWSMIQTVLE